MWDMANWGWLAVIVGGPLLIGLVALYGAMRNRQRTESEKRRTERATDQLYEEEDRHREI